MAFGIDYMGRVSSGANNQTQKVWIYNGTATGADDTVAQIAASGYFNNFMVNLTLGLGPLSIGDVIFVNGSDGSGMYQVDAITTNVTVAAYEPTGIVDTANLADGAVTAAKLDSDAVTTVKILDANVTTGKLADDAVTTAKLSPLTVQYAAVAITAAEFNGMYAAPKLLVAAGGANTLLVLDRVVLAMTYDSAAYAAGGVAHVQYDSTANGAGVIASTTLAAASFQDTASTVYSFNAGVVEYPFATCVNKGLYLSNITGAFTTGDSDMVAHVWYKVIPTV
jgi:hypothetical protein